MKGKNDICQVSVWTHPVAWWYNIKDLVWLCHCSALRCQLHPRAGPQHGHEMVTSSSLVSSGKQRAPSRKHQYFESVRGGQTLKVQVSREIPCANCLQPMIFSRNHCKKQGGINLTGLDQSEPASCSCVSGQSLPKQMFIAQWEREWRADELHPGYKWGRIKQKHARAVCKIGLSQRSGLSSCCPSFCPVLKPILLPSLKGSNLVRVCMFWVLGDGSGHLITQAARMTALPGPHVSENLSQRIWMEPTTGRELSTDSGIILPFKLGSLRGGSLIK